MLNSDTTRNSLPLQSFSDRWQSTLLKCYRDRNVPRDCERLLGRRRTTRAREKKRARTPAAETKVSSDRHRFTRADNGLDTRLGRGDGPLPFFATNFSQTPCVTRVARQHRITPVSPRCKVRPDVSRTARRARVHDAVGRGGDSVLGVRTFWFLEYYVAVLDVYRHYVSSPRNTVVVVLTCFSCAWHIRIEIFVSCDPISFGGEYRFRRFWFFEFFRFYSLIKKHEKHLNSKVYNTQ